MTDQAGTLVVDTSASALLKVVRRLRIRGPGSESTEYELRQAHAVIGSAEQCDIQLDHPDISQRHAYLQVIWGQVACVDLCSRTGSLWDDQKKPMNWLTLNRRVQLGPYVIELIDDGRGNQTDLTGFPLECNALLPEQEFFGPLPSVEFEWLNASSNKPRKRIKRLITLVGRRPGCQLRLDDPSVSRVHCSLVLTQRRFWIVDLLGRGGTLVNGEAIGCHAPNEGDVLQVGDFLMKVRMRGNRTVRSAASKDCTTKAPEQSPPAVDGEHRTPAPPPTTDSHDGNVRSIAVSGFGEVFDVNLRDTTLVVVPARERLSHNYADLQHEMQLLVQQVQRPQVQHVIFDLGGVEYVGSEVIGVIVHISKQVCDGGGRAAMCNADYKMHRVLDSMQLFNLWPYYDTFPEALEAIDKTSTPEGDAGPPPENDGHVLIEDEDPIESASESVITLDWLGSLFAVAREESALVVSPLIRGGMFEYTQLHTESNALLRKLDHPELEALVIDLGQVEYSGSELIGVIVKLGRKMTDDGRKAVLCNASSHMRNVLCKMSLDQLWPMFDSRQQALSSVFR